MLNTLFSPSGRLGPQAFMKGMITIAVISALTYLLTLVSTTLGGILQFAAFLLIIPLFFMLIKRSRDAGKSGWMSIVWFLLILVVTIVIAIILSMIFPSPVADEMKVVMETALKDGSGLMGAAQAVEPFAEDAAREGAIPSALMALLGTTIGAYLVNMLNKRDGDNQHGPA